MGNSNSGQVNVTQGPPLWTQSLPRDAHRKRKSEKIQGGTKVLPERIPGQRLKPTENGRNLHVQGTISTRKLSEVSHPPPDYLSPLQQSPNHHSSMTALNNPNNLPPSSLYPPNNESNHSSRLGGSSSKSFARSEPDLRSSSPSSHVSLPNSPTAVPPHTVISESPTKGKIKSKKRYKAPPPPPQPLQGSISFPLDRSDFVPSPNISFENQSSISSPPSKSSKNKPKKIGLFKKRNESRMSNYEAEPSGFANEIEEKHRNIIIDGKGKQRERSMTPTPIQISSHKELKERAKSLDNLQHEIGRSPQNGLAASLHSLEIIGNSEKEDGWQRVPYENNQRFNYGIAESGKNNEVPFSVTLEGQNKNHRRLSSVERKLYERQLMEQRSEGILSSPVGDPKRFDILNDKSITKHRHMSSSSCSSCTECNKQVAKDEWDLAEEEWLEKKKKSDILQKEIVHVVKNLKRTSISPEPEIKPSLVNRKEIHIPSDNLVRTRTNDRIDAEDLPKTFFFGMDPGDRVLEHGVEAPLKTNSALSKLNDQDEVKILGSSVEYSRHSLKPKEKRRSLEREHWNRSLDYRESRSRNSKSKERDFDHHSSRPEGKKRISKEVDEFAATIEREKIKQRPVDELSNSISRKGDGGYHSRQNSGSFNLGNEGSDEDNLIRMNLRPTLPRRQLELPRFSPNAAWRLLSVETSGKQKELQSEVTLSDDHFSISEDRIHRYTRPTAPPRASGEKSADSGISGDAGSPGPLQEFEPLAAQVKVTHGPLAASSPVASGRIDIKRAWTPAQDLDDNSFEEHNNDANGKGSLHYEVSTLPKLTSRSNMFCKQSLHSSRTVEEERYNEFPIEIEPPHPFSDNLPSPVKYRNEDYQMDARSLQRSKKASPPNRTSNLTRDLQETSPDDDWRENWSMSRSIPNSLNAFDERDCVDGTSAPCRSKSESRVSLSQLSDNKSQGLASKTTVPGYMNRGNSGHIMYLPEYKAYQLSRENLNQSDNGEIIDISTPEHEERKSPSGDENPTDPESVQWNIERQAIGDPEQLSKGKRFIVLNGKKNKKFSYQSTVRMMEKKKLEDKLSKEVEEKEKRRIQEMEAMMKVEQEFQEKREREKKRLKQQLQFFQEQQQQDHKHLPHQPQQKESKAVNNFGGKLSPPRDVFDTHERLEKLDKFDDSFSDIDHPERTLSPTPSSQSPAPPFAGHRSSSSYQSLPMELVNSNGYPGSNHQGNQSGLLSGFKNWVKGKKDPKLGRESRSGYLSDASSVTAHSSSRQEPDGAPASSPSGRKNLDSIRAEIIAGARHRNGNTILERETSTPSSGRYRGDSPVPSILSKDSHRRTMTPDSRRPVSPESRKSAASEGFPLTQELPEMRQEQRQYREYRRSARKNFLPNLGGQIKPSNKASPATHNYRRDFCLGNLSNSRTVHHQEDVALYSRHSNETRKSSKHNKKNYPMDPDGRGPPMMTHSLRRQYPPSKGIPVRHSVPMPIPPHHGHRNGFRVISPPFVNKGYPPPHAAPYNPNRGYRPVSFSPTQGNILTVT